MSKNTPTTPLPQLTDHELYLLVRKLSEQELAGLNHRAGQLNNTYDECERRDKVKIFDDAQADAEITYFSRLENIYKTQNFDLDNRQKIVKLNRIDYMTPDELMCEVQKSEKCLTVSEVELKCELIDDLVKYAAANNYFVCEARGESMTNAGVLNGAKLIVEKSPNAKAGDLIIAQIDNDLFVKRLDYYHSQTILRSENSAYPDIVPDSAFKIWGVVKLIIQTPA